MPYRLTTGKTWAQTEAELRTELGRWRVKDYFLESGKQRKAREQGKRVAPPSWMETPEEATVYLTLRWQNGREMSWRYNKQARAVDNLRVLYLAVQALRLNETRGIDELLREAYAQLPGPATAPPKRSPHEVLHVEPNAPLEVAEASYRALAKLKHPDAKGGSAQAMAELNEAIEQLRKGQTAL